MLVLTRKTNERIMIGNGIEISIVEIRGDQVKIGVVAPKDVKVFRYEVYEAIQNENRAAASSGAAATELDALSQLWRDRPAGGADTGVD